MKISQENLIANISNKTQYTNNTVKDILKGAEECIKDFLVEQYDVPLEIEIWDGLKIKRGYTDENHYVGMLKNMECSEKVKIKAVLTRHFREKINKKIFKK